MAVIVTARVHSVVLVSIVDSYERRQEDSKRVIGTLLGSYDKGIIEVTNAFAVPHNESEDEVAVDIEFARNMYDLHRKVNPSEVIVGWYSSGSDVTEHSVLIHEYYTRECKNPIHMTVDTSLRGVRMAMKGYVSTAMGAPGKTIGTMFTPVPIEVTYYEPERVGMDFIQQGKHNPKRLISMTTDLQQVTASCDKMGQMLQVVQQYVDDVINGRIPADSTTGRSLMDLVNTVPRIEPAAFEEMMNSNMKDLLMVVYLSQLTRTQLMLNEKLSHL